MKVFLLGGGEQWLLIHTEVQGYNDAAFARRMFTYCYRILDKYGQLPATLAIFLNDKPEFQPSAFLAQAPGTRLEFHYQTFAVDTQPFEALYQPGNPFGLVMQLAWVGIRAGQIGSATTFDHYLTEQKLILYRKMLADGYSKAKTRIFVLFLTRYLRLRSATAQEALSTSLLQGKNAQTTMGVEELVRQEIIWETREKSKLEGKLTLVQNLIRQTDFSDERIAQLAEVAPSLVQQVRQRLLAGNTDLAGLMLL